MDTDQEETKEAQESRIEYFKKKGNQQFTEDGRNAEITVDLVLQARAKLSDNIVNGPEDAIVNEMIKKLPMDKIYILARGFQERYLGQMASPSSWKVVKLVFWKKPDAAPTKGIKSYWVIALTSIVFKWYASCVLLRLEKESEPRKLRNLHMGGVNGISWSTKIYYLDVRTALQAETKCMTKERGSCAPQMEQENQWPSRADKSTADDP